MATNSVKYGALSAQGGQVTVALREDGDDMIAEWVETGGPAPADHDARGFGTRLIDMSVTSQLNGTIDRDWREEGLAVTLRLPRKTLAN